MAKKKTSNASSAIQNRARNQKNGRKETLDKRRQIREGINKKKIERFNQEKDLKKLQKQYEKVKAQAEDESDQEAREKLEITMKELLSSCNQMESNLKGVEADLMELDTEMAQLENDAPGGREEDINAAGEEDSENIEGEGDGGNATHDDLHTDQQSEGTDTSAAEESLIDPNLPSTNDKDGDDNNQMFVSQAESSDRSHPLHVNRELEVDPRSANQPSVHQTREILDESPLFNKEPAHRPTAFDDFDLQNFVDLTGVDDTPTFSLEDGTVSVSARSGKLFMNSYGPRNSPMFIWSTTAASYRVDNVRPLLGSPHKQAMLRDDDLDAYIYKGKLGPIKAVAWQPRNGGDSMISILDSVEELNPSKKLENPKYIYPFSTVMVDLEETKGYKRQTVWIDRSKYKTLSSAGKDSSARTDRKFYEKARDQVKYFRDWAGKDLDDAWNGKAREATEPELNFRNKSQNVESQTIGTPNGEILLQRVPRGQSSLDKIPQTIDKPSTEDAKPEVQNGQNISSGSRETVSNEEDDEPALISEFYESLLMKKDVDPETPWKELDDKIFAQFKAASKIYIRELKKQDMKIVDDMGFGKAFKM
ncbi:hypothetical protein N7490_006328 [Penicillium lividum]|nr:hypothetical protein N7490_006328 [Penicillium lividum]